MPKPTEDVGSQVHFVYVLTHDNGSDSRTDLSMDHLPQVGLHFEVSILIKFIIFKSDHFGSSTR